MALPPPEADELGRVVWGSTPADVSRAYRRLSLLVHPDKNPGIDAQTAFEALKQSHKLLKDPGELVRFPHRILALCPPSVGGFTR